jgi:pimeloyl-ACP methyl ester carboxylesterase
MKILKWTGITLLFLCAAFAVFLFILFSRNSEASYQWTRSPDSRGSLVSVGGHRLFCSVRGQGKPVVVIEGDVGSSSPEWWALQDAISSRCTVVTYDRAGYGWSDPGPFPRTIDRVAGEMETMLRARGLQGPYILVGAGMGALYVQRFASLHSGEVMGLILVEPYAREYSRFRDELDPVIYRNLFDRMPGLRMARILGGLGVIRLFRAAPYMNPPERVRSLIMENYSRPAALDSMIDEYSTGMMSLKSGKVQDVSILSAPVVVIHHSVEQYRRELISFYIPYNKSLYIEDIWMDMHRSILARSSGGRMVYALKGKRNIHMEEPDIIIKAVFSMLK